MCVSFVYLITGLWAVGVALGYTLTFPVHLRLRGLWIGIICGIFTTATLCLTTLLRTDWAQEARDFIDKHRREVRLLSLQFISRLHVLSCLLLLQRVRGLRSKLVTLNAFPSCFDYTSSCSECFFHAYCAALAVLVKSIF